MYYYTEVEGGLWLVKSTAGDVFYVQECAEQPDPERIFFLPNGKLGCIVLRIAL